MHIDNQKPRGAEANGKQNWVRPELQRLEAGAAESGENGNFDASSPQRS